MPDDVFSSDTVRETVWDIPDHLNSEEKEMVEKFRSMLYVKKEKENIGTGEKVEVIEESLLMVTYKKKMAAYFNASKDYKDAEASFHNAISPEDITMWRYMEKDLRQVQESAYNEWVVGGYKNEVEAMAAYIEQVTKPKSFTNNHETAPVIPPQLTNQEKEKVEKFRNLLYVKKEKEDLITGKKSEVIEETSMMVAYKKKMQHYLECSAKYRDAEIALLKSPGVYIGFSQPVEDLKQLLRIARDEWIVGGYKNEVEEMAAYIDQVTKRLLPNEHH